MIKLYSFYLPLEGTLAIQNALKVRPQPDKHLRFSSAYSARKYSFFFWWWRWQIQFVFNRVVYISVYLLVTFSKFGTCIPQTHFITFLKDRGILKRKYHRLFLSTITDCVISADKHSFHYSDGQQIQNGESRTE